MEGQVCSDKGRSAKQESYHSEADESRGTKEAISGRKGALGCT